MVTWAWPTHSLILAMVAVRAARRHPRPPIEVEVVGVDVEVEPDLPGPPGRHERRQVEGGLAVGEVGQHAQRFGLAGAELVGVAEGAELVGGVADQVVELGQVQGVAAGVQLAGPGVLGRGGVEQFDVPGRFALVLTPGVFLGVEPRDGVGDQPVHEDRTAAGAVGEPVVDPPRRFQRELVGVLGGPAGLPRRHLRVWTRAPQPGEAVGEVEGVGQQLRTGRGRHLHRGREGFGGERRDRRRPVTAQRLVQAEDAGQGGVGVVGGHPGLGRRGVQDAPLDGQLQPSQLDHPGFPFGGGRGREHHARVEVVHLAHGTYSTIDHRH